VKLCRCITIALVGLLLIAWAPGVKVYRSSGFNVFLAPDGQLLLAPKEPAIFMPVTPGIKPGTQPTDAQVLIELATANLAKRLGITGSEVELASLRRMTFRDTSLGKPESGQTYAQVITEGYEIVLRSGAASYIYHGAGRHIVFIGEQTTIRPEQPGATQ